MTVDHLDVVYVAKTYGLVFLVAFFVIATVYALSLIHISEPTRPY